MPVCLVSRHCATRSYDITTLAQLQYIVVGQAPLQGIPEKYELLWAWVEIMVKASVDEYTSTYDYGCSNTGRHGHSE